MSLMQRGGWGFCMQRLVRPTIVGLVGTEVVYMDSQVPCRPPCNNKKTSALSVKPSCIMSKELKGASESAHLRAAAAQQRV
jgi:hypothetical protein